MFFGMIGNNGAGSLPGPSSIAGLSLWLDPSRGITTTSGHVSGWVDQSSNAISFSTIGIGATQTTVMNGEPTISISATGAGFVSSTTLNTILGSQWTSMAIFQYTGSVAATTATSEPGIICDTNGDWGLACSTTTCDTYQADTFGLHDNSSTISGGTNYYVVSKWDGGILYQSLNGGTFFSVGCTGIASKTGTLNVGFSPGFNVLFQGVLADIVVYNTLLSSANITTLQNWAHSRYGI